MPAGEVNGLPPLAALTKAGYIFGSDLPIEVLRGAGGNLVQSIGSKKPMGLPPDRHVLLADPYGAVAQLVRAPDCRSGGCGFDSRRRRFEKTKETC